MIIPYRFKVVFLSFLAVFICYIDRVNISVAIIPMQEQFGWSESQVGIILGSFYFGYMITMILGGYLADKYGGKKVLGYALLIWSLFTIITPFFAYQGLWWLILIRILMGLGEGALKLKELSYIHAEGYPAGEMKHGPLALIEEGMPVVVIAPRDDHYEKTLSNMQEVIARGAKVLLITNKSSDEIKFENLWEKIEVETSSNDLNPFLLTLPLQNLAYFTALSLGHDIDKPRNLAKSVTVE